MPIAELGYRRWEGERVPAARRWLAITRSHIAITLRGNRLLRRFLFFAWVPVFYLALVFFAVGYVADPSNELTQGAMLTEIAREILPRGFIEEMRANPEVILPAVWATAFFNFFWMSQSVLAMVVVSIVAPSLISRDVRTKAFLLYFSKPIGVWEYIAGKLGVVLFFVFAITLFPAVLLYVISIVLAPDAGTLVATAPILARIFLASLTIGIPVSLVALAVSALTREHRIAAFLWMALWIFGEISYRVIAFEIDGRGGVGATWGFLASLREVSTTATAGVMDVHGYIGGLVQALVDAGVDRELLRQLGSLMASSVQEQAFAEALGDAVPPAVRPSTIAIGALAAISVACALWIRRRVTKPVRI